MSSLQLEATQQHFELSLWTKGFTFIKVSEMSKRKEVHSGDRIFFHMIRGASLLVLALPLLISIFLYRASSLSISKMGFPFIWTSTWDAVRDQYGALPVIYGTLVSSFLALLIAAPVSIGIALFISEILPKKLGSLLSLLVDILAAIPSVVYGLWGIFVLAPFLRDPVGSWFTEKLGFIPFFSGPAYGVGMLAGGLVLAIMIIPTITSISREIFRALPQIYREAALGLGATRWEMIRIAVLKSSTSGLFGALILGLGRALGETMAITMVIGNRSEIALSIFAPSQTMASLIANEYAEATSDTHLSALAEIGLVLFVLSFLVNAIARFIIWRATRVRFAQ